jgi:hypothetical protein
MTRNKKPIKSFSITRKSNIRIFPFHIFINSIKTDFKIVFLTHTVTAFLGDIITQKHVSQPQCIHKRKREKYRIGVIIKMITDNLY